MDVNTRAATSLEEMCLGLRVGNLKRSAQKSHGAIRQHTSTYLYIYIYIYTHIHTLIISIIVVVIVIVSVVIIMLLLLLAVENLAMNFRSLSLRAG